MDNQLARILLDIQREVSETKTMITDLSGPDGRIKKLEREQVRHWWLTVAVAPVLALAHATARKLGVQI